MKKHLKDYFIPHAGNEYQPHSLRQAALVGMTALILLSFAATNVQSLLWISSEWMVSTILPGVVIDLTNDERDDFELGSLRRNPTLDQAARLKAEHMAQNEYFSHYSPDGVSPWYWFSQTDYRFVHAGENLAIHFSDSDQVVDAWMNSPTHRENILNGNYTEIGVGAASGMFEGYQTVYVVQLFGTPAAAPQPVAVTPPAVVTPEPTPQPVVTAETESDSELIIAPEVEPALVIEDPVVTESVIELAPEPTPANQQIAGSEEVVEDTADGTEVSLSTARDPIVLESEPAVIPTTTEEIEIAAVEVVDETVSLYSGTISSSTGAVPASIDPSETVSGRESSSFFSIATQPQTVLQILYTIIGLVVVIALALSVAIEWRRHHPVQIAYSAGLMAVMALLFYIHVTVTSGALVV